MEDLLALRLNPPRLLRTLSPSSPSAEVTEEAGRRAGQGTASSPMLQTAIGWHKVGFRRRARRVRVGRAAFFFLLRLLLFFFPRQGGRPMASGGIACVAPLIYGASLSHRIPSPCRPRWRRGPEALDSQEQIGGLWLSEERSAAKESSCSPVQWKLASQQQSPSCDTSQRPVCVSAKLMCWPICGCAAEFSFYFLRVSKHGAAAARAAGI